MKYLVCIFVVTLLQGCAGTTNFKQSETSASFTKGLSKKILVAVEVSHLAKAFTGNPNAAPSPVAVAQNTMGAVAAANLNRIHSSFYKATNAVGTQLVNYLAKEDINADFFIINSLNNPNALVEAIRKAPEITQILIVNADSFPMVQQTRYGAAVGSPFWGGSISWAVRLLDRETSLSEGSQAVWTAKTNPSIFNPNVCSQDEFKTCAERFSEAVISQLRKDNILRAK